MKVITKGETPWFTGARIDCDRCHQVVELEDTDASHVNITLEKNVVKWTCQNCGEVNKETIKLAEPKK